MSGTPPYADRRTAGRQLADLLRAHAGERSIVLALPRGGVPIADEIARSLAAPLEVWVARKIGAPRRPEVGMGAIAEGPTLFLDEHTVKLVGARPREVRAIVLREIAELGRRVDRYRHGEPPPDVTGLTAIIVDDGIATGGTIRATVRAVRTAGARRIVLAVPVGAPRALAYLAGEVDAIVCPLAPQDLMSVGAWYGDFRQLDDNEVLAILDTARARQRTAPARVPA